MISKIRFFYFLVIITVISCSKDASTTVIQPQESPLKEITIFHINDQHGKLENFSKIKHIIDEEKKITNVFFVCSGDIFSGNPVVDNHEEKGFPMIDLMNKVGIDVAVIGNHEFDYGESILKDRFQQSQFDWVCANVDMNATGIKEPYEYKTITKDNVKVTFLGLIETNGSPTETIPLTHPWRVKNLTFKKYTSVIENYASVKETEQSDLYIALTHLGDNVDANIATNYTYFDFIIGGHSHQKVSQETNGIPIFQAGSNLNYLGKINITIENKQVKNYTHDLIDLSTYTATDTEINSIVQEYNDLADLDEVIGFAETYHSRTHVGNFYTEALKYELNADLTFQNTGGVRSDLNKGDITKKEIYTIDPFNNGALTYSMTIGEIKTFLKDNKVGLYYAGLIIEQDGNTIEIRTEDGQILNNNTTITLGINDYIPAVYSNYFNNPIFSSNTTAENLIHYLETNKDPINFTTYQSYFKFE